MRQSSLVWSSSDLGLDGGGRDGVLLAVQGNLLVWW